MEASRRGACLLAALGALVLFSGPARAADVPAVEVGSLATVDGIHEHPLVGYGLVAGLAGTGDTGQAVYTAQSVANMLREFGIRLPPGTLQASQIGNVAAVMVTGDLPPFAPRGMRFPVTVTSLGNAKSLAGGVLLQTPLRGLDGEVHAIAQGALVVGGAAAGAPGAQVQVNVPTSAIAPTAGEVVVPLADVLRVDERGQVRLVLRSPDYQTAAAVARAVAEHGLGAARALDAVTVAIVPPPGERDDLAAWVGRVMRLRVQAHMPARVVIDERTGTLIAGGDVRLLPAAVAHGSIKVVITTTGQVSQPPPLSGGQTTTTQQSQVQVAQGAGHVVLVPGAATLGTLVSALNALGVSAQDLVAIVQALYRAGALQAELVVL